MNIDTGKLFESFKENKEFYSDLVSFCKGDMTEKQKKTMRVSLHDNRSKLGKLRISEKTKRNRAKRLRKKNLK